MIAVGQARRSDLPSPLLAPIEAWFSQQGWTPLPFQRQAWAAYLAGESGLIQVPTGSGKTYAAVMGPIAEMLAVQQGAVTTQRRVQDSVQTVQKQGESENINTAPLRS